MNGLNANELENRHKLIKLEKLEPQCDILNLTNILSIILNMK